MSTRRWSWWHERWARHLVASMGRRLETEACTHDGTSLCPICRLVTCVGFLPAAAAATVRDQGTAGAPGPAPRARGGGWSAPDDGPTS